MKSLYIAFIPLIEGDGITKKVKAQHRALLNNGLDIKLAHLKLKKGVKYYNIDGSEKCLGNRLIAKLTEYRKYNFLYDYILSNNIQFVYIRYTFEASYWYIKFLKKIKRLGVQIFLEIPTYPYDGEMRPNNLYQYLLLKQEKRYRNTFGRIIDKIITYSSDETIYGVECINISNAIDLYSIKLRENKPTHDYIKFTGVATLAFWHGYDRLIRAFHSYYLHPYNRIVKFDIIGVGLDYNNLRDLVNELSLNEHVKLYGRKDGEDLSLLFDDADICVGSLARHRSGVYEMKALKNIEYAARGIPFIYSEINRDFDNMDYVYKVPSDESLIDINEIINNIDYNSLDAQKIRESVHNLSWIAQMQKVVGV